MSICLPSAVNTMQPARKDTASPPSFFPKHPYPLRGVSPGSAFFPSPIFPPHNSLSPSLCSEDFSLSFHPFSYPSLVKVLSLWLHAHVPRRALLVLFSVYGGHFLRFFCSSVCLFFFCMPPLVRARKGTNPNYTPSGFLLTP